MEAIADAPNGLDQWSVAPQFFANRSDMHVDCAFQHNGIVAQSGIDQLGATEDASLITDEKFEQSELTFGQGKRGFTNCQIDLG